MTDKKMFPSHRLMVRSLFLLRLLLVLLLLRRLKLWRHFRTTPNVFYGHLDGV